MKISLCLYVSVLEMFLFMHPAFSQHTASDSISTEEITVTANRIRMTPLLSPNKVQLLNREFISSINGSKLSDALSLADAVFIKDYGFNSGLKTISLNSTQSEQTLILLDGIKLNNRQNSLVDVGLLQLDEINRIEISNGGSSSLYGGEAIGGVINIITEPIANVKDGREYSANLNLSAGSFNLKKVFLRLSKNSFISERFGGALSYSYESSDNDYNYYIRTVTGTTEKLRQNADYFTHAFRGSGELSLDKNSTLHFSGFYSYWFRHLPGIELGYNPSSSVQIDRDLIACLSYNRLFPHGSELTSSVDYKYSLMSYYDPATFNLPFTINSFYKLNTLVHNSEYKTPLTDKIFLDAGYEINYSTILSNEVEYGKSIQAGLYSACKIEAGKITLYPSLRYDHYSETNSNVLTGKLGINVKPFSKLDLAFKSSVGNNFRPPSFNDLFWFELGNKRLLPEKSISFDAGIYYDFHLLAKNTFEFSYFNINTTDRIIWQPSASGVWRPSNIGKVRSEGIDISFRSRLSVHKKLTANFSLNYNFAKSLKENQDFPGDNSYLKQLIYLPQEYFRSSFMLNYLTTSKVLKSVSFNVYYTFTGKRFTNPENTVFVPYYELLDANISLGSRILGAYVLLKFAVNNLTNTNYQVVSGYPMPLRNYKFEIGLKY